jgi:pimeloyl-ACP methyl ester carboxylesterase
VALFDGRHGSDRGATDRFAEFFESQGGRLWAVRSARRLAHELEHDHLTRMSCPVIVVHGARDRVIPVTAGEALHRAIPGSAFVVGKTWGHCPQLDDPAGLALLLLDLAAGEEVAWEATT